jgi:hypothetical protein
MKSYVWLAWRLTTDAEVAPLYTTTEDALAAAMELSPAWRRFGPPRPCRHRLLTMKHQTREEI